MMFLNLSKTVLPTNKFAIQARESKRQNIAQKQKSMLYNLFPNERKDITYPVDFKAKIKT